MIFRISKAPASRQDNISTDGKWWLYEDGKAILSSDSRLDLVCVALSSTPIESIDGFTVGDKDV